MSAHRYKKVAKVAAPLPTIRQLVAEHGDVWWCYASRAHKHNAAFHDASTSDYHDARRMGLMERGMWPRCDEVAE